MIRVASPSGIPDSCQRRGSSAPPSPWLTLFTALIPGSVACYSAVQQWQWQHRPRRIGAISWFMTAMLAALSLEQVLSAVHTWAPQADGHLWGSRL